MKTSHIYFIVFLIYCNFSFGQDCNNTIRHGEGTFYGGIAGSSGGNCSLPVPAGDIYHCAMNHTDYDGSNACGACIEVTGPNGTITLKVVDRCPECAVGDVDMTEGAFAQIADISDGRVPISWKYVPCGLDASTSIKVHFKEGSSEFWTAIQLRDTEHAIATLEYEDTNGDWVLMPRQNYNFFLESSGIASPMKLRATPIIGTPLIFENVPIDLINDIDTGQQFITPPECLVDCLTTSIYTTASGWDNGVPDTTTEAVFAGDYNTSLGNITACQIVIKNGATLTISPNQYALIEKDITVEAGGAILIEHQGSLVQTDDTATVTNNGTIQVAITTAILKPRDFMIVGSPMTEVSREGDFILANKLMYHDTTLFVPNADVAAAFPLAENFADDNNNNYINHTGILNAGEGYLLRPRPVSAIGNEATNYTFTQGTLTNGVVIKNIIFMTDQNGSFNLLANPYPSAINATEFINENTMIDAVYFWEHVQSPSPVFPGAGGVNFSMEDVSVFNLVGGVAAASDPATTPNGFISTAQGFGIKANAGGMGVFNNSMRVTDNNNTLRNIDTEDNKIWLTVTNNNYNLSSSTLIGFMQNATPNLDAGYDSRRIATAISLYSHLEDGSMELGIQGREAFNVSKVVPLGFTSTIDENVSYEMAIKDIKGIAIENTTVYVVDTHLNMRHNLNESNYLFHAEKGVQNNRFLLQFEDKNALTIDDVALNSIVLSPNPTQGIITVVSPKIAVNAISVVTVNGEIVHTKYNIERISELNISAMSSGVYFLKIETDRGVLVKKIIKK